MEIITNTKLNSTAVYDAYWKIAHIRQNIFFSKLEDEKYPWTDDQIIGKYKFTNAYRASDRVSQYLINRVIYNGIYYTPEDLCFRILLFKTFNKIETWEYLEDNIGEILYSTYRYEYYNELLMKQLEIGNTIYSAAYIMPSGKSHFGNQKKHQNNLRLLEYIMQTKLSLKIGQARSLEELYKLFLQYPSIGSFLAYQYAIDINYSELCDFDEMSFVIAGPGAKNGIVKCFGEIGKYTYEDIIKYCAENQEEEFSKRAINFKTLFGRKLQLIDCQNLFCETDKYARIAYPDIEGVDSRKRIKQQYKESSRGNIECLYPPKWRLDYSVR